MLWDRCTLIDYGHPENQNCEQKSRGIRKRKHLPPTPDCESNHFKTLAAWGGKSGISLQQPAYCGPWKHTGRCWFTPTKTLWDIEIVCVRVSDLGVSSMLLDPWSHRTRGTTQSEEPLGLPFISKAVNLQRRCPPDASLTCTRGTISSSVSRDDLRLETPGKTLVEPWLGPPHRGWWEGRVRGIQTPTESCLLSFSAVSPFQSFKNRPGHSAGEGARGGRGSPHSG